MTKKDNICKCGPPYFYAPVMPNGPCRFCYKKPKILTLKNLQMREIGYKI